MTTENKPRRNAVIAAAVVLVAAAAITAFLARTPRPTTLPRHITCEACMPGCLRDPDNCDRGDRLPGGTIVVAVGKSPRGWNPGAIRGSVGDTAEEVTPLLPSAYVFLPSGLIRYNRDLLAGDPTVSTQLQVAYRISPGAVWNDGTGGAHPVTAQDFVFAWRTHDGHDKRLPVASTAGYDRISSVVGSPDGKTVTVTFREPYADWRGLFTLLEPYWFAAAAAGADPADAARLTDAQLEKAFAALDAVPKFSAGPYMIREVGADGSTVEVPNPLWYGAIKPTLQTITFRAADRQQVLTLLQNKDIAAYTATPDPHTVLTLSGMVDITYEITPGHSWEQLQFNTADPFLRDATLRAAIMDAIDVQALIDKAVKPFFPDAQRLYNHNLFPGQIGYWDIVRQYDPAAGTGITPAADKLLTDAGYTGVGTDGGLKTPDGRHVTITLVHTDTAVRDQAAQLIRDDLARLGATVTDRVTSDLPAALTTHRFGIAEFSVASNPPYTTFRDLWGTHSPGNFTGWRDPRSDGLLATAARTMDQQQQATLLNQQDQILTAAHVDLPLYQLPQLLVYQGQYVNIRPNPAGYITYNIQEWGLLKTSG